MPRNGREQSNEDLRREAALRRAAIKRTAQALEERLRQRTGQIAEAFDRTRDQIEGFDDLVHRHRYLFIGGAVGIGLALARRSSRRHAAPVAPSNGIRYVMMERPRPGLLRSLAGGLFALALRQGAQWLAGRLSQSDDDEPLMLPPASPPR
jgi:ElaB/YqjD/DUF883 family membrane-anchored ribosome-binding protein